MEQKTRQALNLNVIMNGASTTADKKFVTLRKRFNSMIKQAHHLSMGLRKRGLLPIFVKQVFKQVLIHGTPNKLLQNFTITDKLPVLRWPSAGNDYVNLIRWALIQSSLKATRDGIQPGCLERFFNDGKAPDPDLLTDHLSVLPDWTLLPLMKGTLPSYMIYILLLRPVIQGVQVEDHSLPSGNITSRPIRQVFYGLLLGESREVEEYDREDKNLTSSMVEAVLPSAAQQLQLDTLDQAPHPVRLEVFLETLGVSRSTLNGVPSHLGLPVAVTYYWLRHAHPRPDLPLLQALLLGLVYGELCRQRKSQREEGPVLERLRGLIQRGARSQDLGVTHAFSQWKRCMRDGLDLKQLLCLPLPEPQCAW
ncbi:single-strand DNA endonuclease ASTE1-like [Salvelinus sp. IW2-2015]|uniref:single-strand DNA endonuclease ASTE1-like n=1 Tax=Salvelinus sp. IW2-2015 TaxID=2691554 RepID=UPI0038D45371